MKVGELACLLDGLVTGLRRVKATAALAADLTTFETALGPFADKNVADYTAFLLRCEEFERTGVPFKAPAKPRSPARAADPDLVPNAVNALQELLAEINAGRVEEPGIEHVLKGYEKCTKDQLLQIAAGLNVSVPKSMTKTKVFDSIRQVLRRQLEMHDKAHFIRDGAERGAPAVL